ncbi:hypothetical protein [Blastococcus sp. TF02A-26]|nr:hypothetical protein [Blastococcus sp. TF02A-26]
MPSLLRKLLASLAVVGAAAALPVVAAVGSFSDDADPFPTLVEGTAAEH